MKERKYAVALLDAGREHRPGAFAPSHAGVAARALRDAPVDHDMPNRLLGQIVRRLDPRVGQEPEVVLRLCAAKAFRQRTLSNK